MTIDGNTLVIAFTPNGIVNLFNVLIIIFLVNGIARMVNEGVKKNQVGIGFALAFTLLLVFNIVI